MENTQIKSEEPTVTSNSETATVATDVVTSSSPTTAAVSAFQPFQQLHEAVLAAVNSHSVSLPSSIFSAAVAAAAANTNVTIHPQPFDPSTLDHPLERTVLTDAEKAKKENVRASNRERKKKWRLHNEERNKDNDLRCRVNKRANKLYGLGDSPAKQQWINEEFEKRRQKRMDKERRKHIVNNVLSVSGSTESNTTNTINDTNTNGISNMVGSNQISAYYTPLPQIDTATAAKLLDFPADLGRQLLEQLNNSMIVKYNKNKNKNNKNNNFNIYKKALTNGIQQTSQTDENHDNNNSNTNTNNPELDTTAFTNTTENNNNNSNNQTNNNINNNNNNQDNNSEDTLKQVITQGLSATTTAASTTNNSHHNSPLNYQTESTEMEIDESEKLVESEESKEESKEDKKPEYPMDAVLTLMQLNAGWRQ